MNTSLFCVRILFSYKILLCNLIFLYSLTNVDLWRHNKHNIAQIWRHNIDCWIRIRMERLETVLSWYYIILRCAINIMWCAFVVMWGAFVIMWWDFVIMWCAFVIMWCTFVIMLCAFVFIWCAFVVMRGAFLIMCICHYVMCFCLYVRCFCHYVMCYILPFCKNCNNTVSTTGSLLSIELDIFQNRRWKLFKEI